MVKTGGSHRRHITEPALDLISHSQCSHKVTPAAAGILSCCEHGSQVVAGMAGFVFGEIAVVKIKITD